MIRGLSKADIPVIAMRYIIYFIYMLFRDVAQVVERYFREVEAAGSSPVIPIVLFQRNADKYGIPFCMPQILLGRVSKQRGCFLYSS